MKILSRYVTKEILPPTLIGFLLYTFLMVMNVFFLIADFAFRFEVSFKTLLKLFALNFPHIIVLTLPMALLLGVLVGMGRLASDSELVAINASGIGLLSILKPLMLVATVFFTVNAYFFMEALPRGNHLLVQTQQRIYKDNILKQIKPRTFNSFFLREGILLYIDRIDESGLNWQNVFIQRRDPATGQEQIIVADSGRPVMGKDEESFWINLQKAAIHIVPGPAPNEYDIKSSEEYNILIPPPPELKSSFWELIESNKTVREQNIGELFQSLKPAEATPRKYRLTRLEIHKRFAIPFACFVFVLLGLSISAAAKKSSKASSFFISLVVFIIYYIFLMTGEKLIVEGRISPFSGMWSANILLGAVGLFLLILRLKDRELGIGKLAARVQHRVSRWFPGPSPGGGESADGRSEKDGILVRIQRTHLRFPNLIDRYITVEFMKIFFLVLVSGLFLYLVVSLFQMLYDILDNNIGPVVVLQLYKYWLPEILTYVFPVTTLVTSVVTFSLFTRRNEITAIKASGISVYRICVPVLLICAFVSLLSFAIYNQILPHSSEKYQEYFDRIKGRRTQSFVNRIHPWVRGEEGKILYHYEKYFPKDKVFHDVSVFEMQENPYRVARRSFARQVQWKEGTWEMKDGWTREFSADRSVLFSEFKKKSVPFLEHPEYFNRKWKPLNYMSPTELREYEEYLTMKGEDTKEVKVEKQKKYAFPFTPLVMGILGIPFSFLIGRKGALYGIGLSILLGIFYWAFMAFFSFLGEVGVLPPELSAWSPNVIFGISGVYLILALRS